MELNHAIANRVRQLVSKKTGVPEADIRLTSRLLHDLGLDGDDAAELMLEFCSEFGLDVKQVNLDRYFGSEYFPLRFLCSARVARAQQKEPLTVEQLIIAAQVKNWVY